MAYLSELQRLGIPPDTVKEAATRILHTREVRTVPPLAVILKECREVRSEHAQSAPDIRCVSPGEARDLAMRRLHVQEQPVTEAHIEAELKRMELLDVVRVEA